MEVTIGVHDYDLFIDQNSKILEGKNEFILFGCSKDLVAVESSNLFLIIP